MIAYEILTGVGRLYIATVGTAFPVVNATPNAAVWRDVGETIDGVTVTFDQTIDEIGAEGHSGAVEASRSEESLIIETKLAQGTLENLADVLGNTVTDTPPGTGTIGTRSVGMTRGFAVKKFALLFRGSSPYGNCPAQYEVPRGYFGGSQAMEHTKTGQASIPVEFNALEDLNASSESERFGRLVAQDMQVFVLDVSLLDSDDALI